MKKLMFAIGAIAIVGGSSMFTSCKKGENDPFMSFRSRKARVAGEWSIKEGTMTETDNGNTTTTTFTETEFTQTDGTTTVVYTIGAFTMTFEKDGTYEQVSTITLKSVDGVTVTGASATTTTDQGTWAFLGANKDQDRKNKEAIVMDVTSSVTSDGSTSTSTTYTGFDMGEVWYIDQLKNKEMIVTQDYTYTPDGGTTSTFSGSLTYTQD